METFTAWGRTYTESSQVTDRLIELSNANHAYGKSDDRVSEEEAIREAWFAARANDRRTYITNGLDHLLSADTPVDHKGRAYRPSVYCRDKRGMKTIRFATPESARRGVEKLVNNPNLWQFSGWGWEWPVGR